MKTINSAFVLVFFCALTVCQPSAADRPNVVVVMTDDQGYGDLSCHGNPVLQTPAIDRLYAESVRLTDYHVSPTCSPTRAALLTGHWSNRTGVWHTIMGRSMLRENEVTMADVFRAGGYATGMFGKWHLGDNYPYRPEDRGFDEVIRHGGGGVGQTPDHWDNAYFDGSYWHNGTVVPVAGFCTDVFFDYATRFIKNQKRKEQPFLAYIATNAPHGPMHCPESYSRPYQEHGTGVANFYGMIANIDDNIARLRRFLGDEGLTDNTIFIFTTDNGTLTGAGIFNAGMRGRKGSQYDGGHRVPLFVHWPDGDLFGGRDCSTLTAHVDLLPTLIDWCELEAPAGVRFDGRAIGPLLDPATQVKTTDGWPDRILVTDSQRLKDPIKWRQSAVMTSQWRLINGRQLFDIQNDPAQQTNVADQHPQVVQRLRDFYERWWSDLKPTFADETAIPIGHPAANPVRLTSHDWITAKMTPWNQSQVRAAMNGEPNTGFWNIDVVSNGDYQIALRRWPEEIDHPLGALLPPGDSVPGQKAFRETSGKPVDVKTATIRIGDLVRSVAIPPGATEVIFDVRVPEGKTKLAATFETDQGEVYGAYYVYVTAK